MQTILYKRAATNYAVALEKLGKRKESLTLMEDLQKEFGYEVRLCNNRGIVQKRKGEVREAIKSYKNALTADSESFLANFNLAILLAQIGEFHDAICYFERILSKNPKYEL